MRRRLLLGARRRAPADVGVLLVTRHFQLISLPRTLPPRTLFRRVMTSPTAEANGSMPVSSVPASGYKLHYRVSTLARDSKGNYVPERALELIPEVTPILHLFLSGKMKEAEDAVKSGDPKAETLYYPLGMFFFRVARRHQ